MKYINADDFVDWYESYSITDAQREEAAQVAQAVEKFRKLAPANVMEISFILDKLATATGYRHAVLAELLKEWRAKS